MASLKELVGDPLNWCGPGRLDRTYAKRFPDKVANIDVSPFPKGSLYGLHGMRQHEIISGAQEESRLAVLREGTFNEISNTTLRFDPSTKGFRHFASFGNYEQRGPLVGVTSAVVADHRRDPILQHRKAYVAHGKSPRLQYSDGLELEGSVNMDRNSITVGLRASGLPEEEPISWRISRDHEDYSLWVVESCFQNDLENKGVVSQNVHVRSTQGDDFFYRVIVNYE